MEHFSDFPEEITIYRLWRYDFVMQNHGRAMPAPAIGNHVNNNYIDNEGNTNGK
jgi:hypothetical protein